MYFLHWFQKTGRKRERNIVIISVRKLNGKSMIKGEEIEDNRKGALGKRRQRQNIPTNDTSKWVPMGRVELLTCWFKFLRWEHSDPIQWALVSNYHQHSPDHVT